MQPIEVNTLLLFAISIFCTACGGNLIEAPTTTSTPTLSAAYTSLPKTTPVPPSPTSNVISLSEDDEQYRQLKDRGYRLVSSSSVVNPEGLIYSAYLFINRDLSPLFGAAETNKDTMLIAFYRWDGEKNTLLSLQGFPAVDNGYAVGANIVNWDQPFSEGLFLDVFAHTDEDTKSMLNQENYSSDINQNGLPEFSFIVEYCPISCTHPTGGIQLFEVQDASLVKNITEDLPGLTRFEMHSKTPFTFYVQDTDFFDIYMDVSSDWIYTWNGTEFIDVSAQYALDYAIAADFLIGEMELRYGEPFNEGGVYPELYSLTILKLYEKAGMSENGLQFFLEVTDISHWPNTSPLAQCWLQISRAMAQNDLKQNRSFVLPPGSSYWKNNLDMVKNYEEPLKLAGYDTSACTSINP